MSLPLRDVAELVGGRLSGNGGIAIQGAAILRDAQEGDLTLIDKPRLLKQLATCRASAVLCPADLHIDGWPAIGVDDVHGCFAKIVEHFRPQFAAANCGVSPQAIISPTAVLGPEVVIHPGATVGDEVTIGARSVIHSGVRLLTGCRIGSDVTIYPNVVLYEGTVLGDRVIIHAGAVLGAYGFGYETVQGRHKRSFQLGNVEIGDDVEIGSCTTIDRGTYGPTRIGEGTKIDNLVMIAHNCAIGRHNLICSQVGVAGSCTTGDYVVMAGQVGLRDHLTIGDRAVLGAKAGVMTDIPEGAVYVGIPATPEREQRVKQAAWARLPEMRKEFLALQKQLADLMVRMDEAGRCRVA